MICMNYDHNKKFGLLKFYSGYGKFNLNSLKGYSLKIINAQTENDILQRKFTTTHNARSINLQMRTALNFNTKSPNQKIYQFILFTPKGHTMRIVMF